MDNIVIQTIGKAALKTFGQAFIAVLAILLVPVLADWTQVVAGGGNIDIDVNFFRQVLIAATGGGIAALVSLGQNGLRAKE